LRAAFVAAGRSPARARRELCLSLSDALFWFQLDRDFLDLPGEREGQFIGKVDGRPDIHADVQALAQRELYRYRACLALEIRGDSGLSNAGPISERSHQAVTTQRA
jgi:hypothetical protein